MEKVHLKKGISAPALWNSVRQYFAKHVTDPRNNNGNEKISIESTMLSASAVFALKFPSLLQFDQHEEEREIKHNLKTLFGVQQTPCDTQMREIIDQIEPEEIEGAFDVVFAQAQRNKVLEDYAFLDRGYLLSIDGTGYFESTEIHCESCCVKQSRNGPKSFYHQFLPAVIVHPNQKQVIPLRSRAYFQARWCH